MAVTRHLLQEALQIKHTALRRLQLILQEIFQPILKVETLPINGILEMAAQ